MTQTRMSGSSLYLKQLELGPMQNFVYLIGDPTTREAVVVDPGWEVPTILNVLEQDGYRLTKVVVTHTHFDHVIGLPELLKAVDVPVCVHEEEAAHLSLERKTVKPLRGGEVVEVGQVPITLIHTPGHTPGSQCLLVQGKLLSGDTLFIGGCGRCDLPGGNPTQLFESLTKRLRALDDQTVLYPGHHYAATPTAPLGDEKRTNPFLRLTTLQEFLHLIGVA